MHKLKILIGIIVFAVLLGDFAVFFSASVENESAPVEKTASQPWFQIVDRDEAHSFTTDFGESPLLFSEKKKLLQIPQDELADMPTAVLVDACLNYPIYAIGMITSNSTMYEGFQRTVNVFNGLQELLIRKDSGRYLLEIYKNIDLDIVLNGDGSSDGFDFAPVSSVLRLRYLEYILAQNDILTSLSAEERILLRDTAINLFIEKFEKYPHDFSVDSTFLLVARLLKMDNYDFAKLASGSDTITHFLSSGALGEVSNEEFRQITTIILNIIWEG